MKRLYIAISVLMVLGMVLSACATPTAETIIETVEVPVVQTQVVNQTQVVKETQVVEVTPTTAPQEPGQVLPRDETLYFNGFQWSAVVGWNPYSSSMNNSWIAAKDASRVLIYETLYLYDMLDGGSYPLLADGPYQWNDAQTEITVKLKSAAHWSDGTPVTADDVVYTWDTNLKYSSNAGNNFKDFVDSVTAVDPQTVLIKSKLDANGKSVNPLMLLSFLDGMYICQKAWTQTLEARTEYSSTLFLADTAEDAVYSGPYHAFFSDDTKLVLVRDDNYWGQDASMFGKLPGPKYIAHQIFKDNAAGSIALAQGEVDVSQQFNANVQVLWLSYGLPISTYLPDAPYSIGATLPTAYYNLKSNGLDQVFIRKAIAIAVDYPTIIANAMTNQSATFDQVPRSLMNPTPGEQALYDHAAVADLQWAGNDIEGAIKLLDDNGVVDTNGDGNREWNGKELAYVATCPAGWSDWQAAIEVVAAAGKKIGINITTNYPDWGVYQTVVTKSDTPLPEGYDIFMMWTDGAGPTQPWGRIRHLLSSEFVGQTVNWNGNWGQYSNPEVDQLIASIPGETDPAKLKATYTRLVEIYLTDIPSFTLMYRPDNFHTVNESVWTGYPHQDDGSNPPVPPMDCIDGWSIACLYNLTLVSP
jgi:peptide/nickel transport system substrate-binding protein